MRTVLPDEFHKGMVLLLEGTPYLIEGMQVVGTAKTKHKLHTYLRNLKSGRTAERVFQDNERVNTADLEYRVVQFSYRQDDRFVFLDTTTYDEVSLTADQIGERKWFLKENEEYKAIYLDGRLLDIVLPDQIALKVEQTAPPQRASAQTTTMKEAVLEGGLQIMVPLFIGPGDVIRVDTQTRKYVGKEGGA